MSKDKKEAKLSVLISDQSQLWGSIFIAGGGGITIFLNYHTLTAKIIALAGLLLCICCINAFAIKRQSITKLINDYDKED